MVRPVPFIARTAKSSFQADTITPNLRLYFMANGYSARGKTGYAVRK
jgi:hypothetical protein